MDQRMRQIYTERAMMGESVGGFGIGGALAKGRRCRKGAVKAGPSGKKRCTKYKTLANSEKKKAAPKRKSPAKKRGGFGVGGIAVGGCGDMDLNAYGEGMRMSKKKAPARKAPVSAAKSENPWIRYISCLAKVQGINYSEALKYYSMHKAELQHEYAWFKENDYKMCPKKKIAERRAIKAPARTKREVYSAPAEGEVLYIMDKPKAAKKKALFETY